MSTVTSLLVILDGSEQAHPRIVPIRAPNAPIAEQIAQGYCRDGARVFLVPATEITYTKPEPRMRAFRPDELVPLTAASVPADSVEAARGLWRLLGAVCGKAVAWTTRR